ncbi:hypothetical protein [Halomarina pelagica]|uniref:hypothetical protein n=1 Tax=Halomarina pelagica TaxID=2961599 RepID=UPI0020C50B40|nr:hypothetical protein [Halomarina sp. BND7]
MVRQAKISKQALMDADAGERDDLLIEQFGLSQADLSRFRSQRVGNAVYTAAKWLVDHDFPRQITTQNLAAMVYEKWDRPEQRKSYVSDALRRRYNNDQRQAEIYYDLSPPYIHFLRDEVGAYDGNLLTVRNRYSSFTPSNSDYLRSIRLPPIIDFEAARLLGVYAVDGKFQTQGNGQQVLLIEGGRDDEAWYECLREKIADVHNLSVNRFAHHDIFRKPNKEYEYARPRIKLQSQALTTWLRDDVGLALRAGHRQLPSPPGFAETPAQQRGLLADALAGMGRIDRGRRYETRRTERTLLTELHSLAHTLGFDPNLVEGTTQDGTPVQKLVFNKADIRTLLDQGLLWNPRHRQAINV